MLDNNNFSFESLSNPLKIVTNKIKADKTKTLAINGMKTTNFLVKWINKQLITG